MLDGKFFNNRLGVVVGARQQFSKVGGYQPVTDGSYVYLKNLDGTVYRDSVLGTPIFITGTNWNSYTSNAGSYAGLSSRLSAVGLSLPTTPYWAMNATNTAFTTTPGTYATNLDLTKKRNYIKKLDASRTDPATPSIVLSYKLTDDFDVKASWSHETKQSDLEGTAASDTGGLLSSVTSAYDDTTGVTTYTVNNPGLKPEKTNSYNLQLSYYTKTGGSISVSGYYKTISNEWETLTYDLSSDEGRQLADTVGIFPTNGDLLKTTINGATSSTKRGLEAEIRQNLGVIGEWANGFDAFATYTYKTHGSLSNSVGVLNPQTGRSVDKYSAGLSFSTKRFTLQMRGTYATAYYLKTSSGTATINLLDATGATVKDANGNTLKYQIYDYFKPEYRINFDVYYRLTQQISLFASVSDAIRSPITTIRYDVGTNQIPVNYRTAGLTKYGATVTAGVTATF
jgi:outer membrane receptor protein involved in Fe transport